MSQSSPQRKEDLPAQLSRLWAPVAAFLGAVTLVYNFYRLWLGDRATVTFILVGGGLLVLGCALAWVGFGHRTVEVDAILQKEGQPAARKKKTEPAYPPAYRRAARAGLGLVVVGLVLDGWFLAQAGRGASCPYDGQAATDAEAIHWLIDSEARAVVANDLEQIEQLFAPDARIVDYLDPAQPLVWENPLDRYASLLAETKYLDAKNPGARAVGKIGGDTAYYLSGSQGTAVRNGIAEHYNNPADANHWSLRKIDGCWKIVEFHFNAWAVSFP